MNKINQPVSETPGLERRQTKPSLRVGVSRSAAWRVAEIQRLLVARPYANCTTLAREIEVSPKTIQRDIDFMRQQEGLPIEYDPVRHGYYFTKDASDLPPLRLTRGELVALFLARKALEPMRGTTLERLVAESVNKIAEACPSEVSFHWQDLDEAFSVKAAGVLPADVELFNNLLDATMNGKEVAFEYHKLRGTKGEQRTVRPYHVMQNENGWYLIGLDVDRGEIRTFALQRLKELRATKTRFIRPPDFNARDHLSTGFGVWSYETAGAHRHNVCLRFEGYAARVVAERLWHPTQSVELQTGDGGTILFRLRVAGLEEITRWVLSWGSKVSVIGPQELRERVKAEAAAIVGQLAE